MDLKYKELDLDIKKQKCQRVFQQIENNLDQME